MGYSNNPVPWGAITLEMFGAVGDGGVTPAVDQAAYTRALAYMAASVVVGQGGKSLRLGSNRDYRVTGGTLPAGCSIIGEGVSSVLSTVSNAPVIVIGGEDTLCSQFQISGTATLDNQAGIQNGQFGVVASGFNQQRVSGVTFERLSTGIDLNQFVGIHNGPVISDCRFDDCGGIAHGKGGIYVGTLAEYTLINACVAHTCDVGLQIAGGNVNVQGSVLTDCTVGLWVRGDLGVTFLNDAHGVIQGCTINHAVGDAIRVDAITNGMLFAACEILGGDVTLTGSSGVRFESCDLVVANLFFDGSTGTVFDGCGWPSTSGIAPIVHNNFNGHSSTTRFTENNFGATLLGSLTRLDGTYPSFILANDDGSGWELPVQAALTLPRQPNESPLATDPGGIISQAVASPLALPGTQLWLIPLLANVTTVGGNVSVWSDASGVGDANRNHTQATPANRPPYVASDPNYNNRPTVGPFTGGAMLLASGVWSAPPPEVGTVMIVCDIPAGVGFVMDSISAQRYAFFRNTADFAIDFLNNVTFGPADDIASRPCIIVIDMNGSLTQVYVNGLLRTGTNDPGISAPTGTTVGNAQAPGGVPTGGNIAEVWISSSRLTAGQRLQLQTYASTRYNVILAQE